jgi:hypothetical protein
MTVQRKLYSSTNGDSWWLCREGNRVFVLHEANPSAGGKTTNRELGEFLGSGKSGPEHQALVNLIGRLVEIDCYWDH